MRKIKLISHGIDGAYCKVCIGDAEIDHVKEATIKVSGGSPTEISIVAELDSDTEVQLKSEEPHSLESSNKDSVKIARDLQKISELFLS